MYLTTYLTNPNKAHTADLSRRVSAEKHLLTKHREVLQLVELVNNGQENFVGYFLIQPLLFSSLYSFEPIIIIIPFKLNILNIFLFCPFGALIVSINSHVVIFKAKQS